MTTRALGRPRIRRGDDTVKYVKKSASKVHADQDRPKCRQFLEKAKIFNMRVIFSLR